VQIRSTQSHANLNAVGKYNHAQSHPNLHLASGASAVSAMARKVTHRAAPVVKDKELEVVEKSLPNILTNKSLPDKIVTEIKGHHKYFSVIYVFNEKFPRSLRVLSMFTTIVTMLFFQSITYNIADPDDGSCERLTNEIDCLQPRSAFATGESKCAWSASSSSCSFVQPNNSSKVIIFVAIFSALISTPIAVFCKAVISRVLAAKSLGDDELRMNEVTRIEDERAVFAHSAPKPRKSWMKWMYEKLFCRRSNSSAVVPITSNSNHHHNNDNNNNNNEPESSTQRVAREGSHKVNQNGRRVSTEWINDSSDDAVPESRYSWKLKPEHISMEVMQTMTHLTDELISFRLTLNEKEQKEFDGKLLINKFNNNDFY
jgi:hypothetical protein